MALISDAIELFILDLLGEGSGVELGRNELAQYFGCAPSQINYVLTTRFSLDKGYIITSKRGGGGSVKIVRIVQDQKDLLTDLASNRLDEEISAHRAAAIIDRLLAEEIITVREAALMNTLSRDFPMVPANIQPYLRAAQLKKAIVELMRGR